MSNSKALKHVYFTRIKFMNFSAELKVVLKAEDKLLKRVILFFALIIISPCIHAQSIANYTFSSSSVTYNALTSATTIMSANEDETVSSVQSIGFDFWYNGNVYTDFIVSSNGFISFTTSMTTADASVQNALNSTNNKLILAPLWDDLSTGTTGSIVTRLNTGNSTQYIREIEFKSMRWNKSSQDNVITFMIRLTQNTNTIEFWYSGGTASVNSGSASIGINGNNSGTQQFISINNSGIASSSAETATVSTKPSSSTLYKFTPAAPAAPSGLTGTALNANSVRFNWTDNATNETGYVVYYSTSANVPLNSSSSQQVMLAPNTTTITLTGLLSNTGYFVKVFALKEGLAGPATGNANTPYCAAVTAPTVTGGTASCGGSVTLSASGSSSGYFWFTTSTGYEPIATTASYVTPALSSTTTYYVTAVNSSGCQSSPRTAVTATITAAPGNWIGSVSRDWNNTSNWCGGTLPVSTTDINIASGTTYSPAIEGITAVCRNLIIASGGTLTNASTGTLNVYGNITSNDAYTDNGTTVMTGSSAQSINGTITFNNFTINNSAGVTLNNATTVTGILTLTSGTLVSNGNLTLDMNTGAIAGTGSGSISGNIAVSKSVSSNKYHFISSPLSGRTVADWNDDVAISPGPQYLNLYKYNESYTDTTKTVGWEGITSLNTSLEDMQGYALYFNGTTTMDETGTYTHSSGFSRTGLTNTVSVTNGATSPESDGWHLIGNPYPSMLDWDASGGWTKTNIDNAIYFWDPVNKRYASYASGAGTNGGTRYIPSMQGFWVKANLPGGAGSLSMNNNVRVTSANSAIYKTAPYKDVLKLKASNGNYSDETIIRFTEDASVTFDSNTDAYKWMNSDSMPSLYTLSGSTKYSINSIPGTEDINIPLKLEAGFSGAYTIEAQRTESFGLEHEIILEDRLTGVKQDLRSNPLYIAEISKADTTGRFYISFRKTSSATENFSPESTPSINIGVKEKNLYLKFSNIRAGRSIILLTNLFGQEMVKIENPVISNGEYYLTLPDFTTGIYLIKVITPKLIKSKKILLSE